MVNLELMTMTGYEYRKYISEKYKSFIDKFVGIFNVDKLT